MTDNNYPLVVVVGETACGKSKLAIDIANYFDGEIICADSWTVYRGFDIGSAKPTDDERYGIKHHLLDVADPAVGFSAALFQGMAKASIDNISARGRLPILVGGTGLYIDSVLFDYGFLPAPTVDLRNELNKLSINELLARCNALDINTDDIDIRNKRRIIRLIENGGVRPTRSSMRSHTLVLGLRVAPDVLRSRIISRVDAMVESGLEHEALRLANIYGWGNEAMKGIGYAEWQSYADGSQSLQETKDQIVAHTLNLAKRQRTWFKRNKCIHWLATEDKLSESVELITTFINE